MKVRQRNYPAAKHIVRIEHLDQDAVLGLVVEFLRQLRVNLLQVLGQVANQDLVVTGIVAQLKMVGRQRRVLFQVVQNFESIGNAHVEWIGVERLAEDGLGFLFPAHAHVEQAQAVFRPGQHGPKRHRFLVALLRVFKAPPVVELVGQDEVK